MYKMPSDAQSRSVTKVIETALCQVRRICDPVDPDLAGFGAIKAPEEQETQFTVIWIS
jgi:hypothetical protein